MKQRVKMCVRAPDLTHVSANDKPPLTRNSPYAHSIGQAVVEDGHDHI